MIGSQSAGMKKLKRYSAAPAAFFREQPFARFRLDETAKGVDDIFSPIGRYFVFAHTGNQSQRDRGLLLGFISGFE